MLVGVSQDVGEKYNNYFALVGHSNNIIKLNHSDKGLIPT
jgi:hypothetical protein